MRVDALLRSPPTFLHHGRVSRNTPRGSEPQTYHSGGAKPERIGANPTKPPHQGEPKSSASKRSTRDRSVRLHSTASRTAHHSGVSQNTPRHIRATQTFYISANSTRISAERSNKNAPERTNKAPHQSEAKCTPAEQISRCHNIVNLTTSQQSGAKPTPQQRDLETNTAKITNKDLSGACQKPLTRSECKQGRRHAHEE